MNARRYARATLVAGLALCLTGSAARAEFMLNPSAHISWAAVGPRWGGTVDLGLSAAWLPISELATGLDVTLVVPLATGDHEQQSKIILQACPVVWLRFGDDDAWGFVKAGLGVAAHLLEEGLEPVMVAVAGGGFVVAPSALPFHFGFEFTGELDLLGEIDTHAIGLGGFVGWLF